MPRSSRCNTARSCAWTLSIFASCLAASRSSPGSSTPRRSNAAKPPPFNRVRGGYVRPVAGRRSIVEDTDKVAGRGADGVGDLVTAAGAVRGEDSTGRCRPELWQYAELTNLHRHLVMLGLVAERPGHAATGRIEGLDGEARDQLQGLHRGSDRGKRLLVTMPVQQ